MNNVIDKDSLKKELEVFTMNCLAKEAQDKMHIERFREIVKALDPSEVEAACDIFAKEHPAMMLNSLNKYINKLSTTYGAINGLMRVLDED